MAQLDRRAHRRAVCVGLVAGFALDRLLGDPPRRHPVAGFGNAAGWLEQQIYRDDRRRGVLFTTLAVGVPVLAGAAVTRAVRRSPMLTAALIATATWTVLGGRSLAREADAVAALLLAGDLPAARTQVARLVGRDTDDLDASEVARAALESVSENSSDAVVAPLLWGAAAGLPGLLGYRAVNTLDAMVGHRSARYERFGWPSARLDDGANWVPARVTAALTILLSPTVGGSPRQAQRALDDAGAHPSPNAGVVEAAFAGALGVTLGGRNHYAGVLSERGTLGDGPPPQAADIARAIRLADMVAIGALLVAITVRLARR